MGNNTEKDRKSDQKKDNVILDNNDGSYLNVDWDTIEENYKNRHRHRHSHSGSSGAKQSAKKINSSDKHDSGFSKHLRKGFSAHNKKKKLSKKQKIIITLISIPLILIILALCLFGIFHHMGKNQLLDYDNAKITFPEDVDYENNGKTVTYDGHTYAFNQNIASILFMGIDNRELVENNFTSTDGLADALYVLTYDTSNGNMKILSLNRDTMTEVIRYDTKGTYHDTVTEQLCMAYGYGNGKETSAENQVISVERLLYNIPINAYYAINLSTIKTLNDDIGGVTVTPEYTFGSFTKGQQITIKGDLAEEFVRHRDTNLLDDNLRRISCQKLYINAFANQIVPAIRKDFSIPMKLYQDTQENTVTNMNISTLTFLASSLATNFKGVNIVSVDGEYKKVKGDASAEFIVDKDDLLKKILDVYYTQIN